MNSNYSATEADFEAIEKALTYVFSPKLNYFFKKGSFLKKVIIISFDSKYIYMVPKKNKKSNFIVKEFKNVL